MTIIPVILSGGVGSRLWPLSREAHPKPFVRLYDNQSLIQKTYLRALDIPDIQEIITITNRELFFYTKDDYKEVSDNTGDTIPLSYILESLGRNTAPAITLASHYVNKKYGPDAILLIFPADHLIEDKEAFLTATREAIVLAQTGKLVTFGIKPHEPKTGYGYIEAEGNQVKQFVEKPNIETAKQYLASGRFFWNSGMFCFTAGTMLNEAQNLAQKIFHQTKECLEKSNHITDDLHTQIELHEPSYQKIDDISIDYAIFEISDKVALVPGAFDWSDIGSWLEFGKLHPQDHKNNNILGETVLEDVENCIIHAEDRIVAGVGLRDLIITDTSDALLIAHRNKSEQVKEIAKILKAKNHNTYKLFPTVHRPWGSYTVLQEGESFKVKRLEVKPNASLSLQVHNHRSEHWIVVSGNAEVTNGEEIIALKTNESTYIPTGHKHRLKNTGKTQLILIEVQCGNYLGEDDIVRFDDIYRRTKR